MKNSRNAKPRRMSAFERETERRRKEMLRNIAGRVAHVPKSTLRLLPRSMRLMLIPPKRGANVQIKAVVA